ncbi:hypothetical protein C8J57DRAFT_1230863 [Mycena rebaudengoi]|nr:hypothetical protein C8J57DRAFT_1230863 [Mycena rebaudengoi]
MPAIPREVFSLLWPSSLKWIHFIHTYWGSLSCFDGPRADKHHYSLFAISITLPAGDPAAFKLLSSTPGVKRHPGSLDKIIEGSRGGISSLPSLIVASMRRALKYTSNVEVVGPPVHVLSFFIDQIRNDLPGNTLLDHSVLKLMVEQWCALRNVHAGIATPDRPFPELDHWYLEVIGHPSRIHG